MNSTERETTSSGKRRRPQGMALYIITAVIICGSFLLPLTAECGVRKAECSGPVAEKGYEFEVMATGLPSVDNLTRTPDGSIYATLERRGGRGEVVRLWPDGKSEVILTGLKRPDGIRAGNGKLFIVEEVKKGRALEYDIKDKTLRVIKRIGHLEGLAVISTNEIFVTKDRKKGKLIGLSLDGKGAVLASGLKRPEGIALGKKGELFIAETSTGRILEFRGGKIKTFLTGLNNPDQLAVTTDGALLITEDANPGRLLSYDKGRLRTIARCLSSPQGILPLEDGILVSEQGRGRVLKFTGR